MRLAEPGRIGKPRQDVAQRADRELDQDVSVRGVVVMRQHPCGRPGIVELPDRDAETNEVMLGRRDERASVFALEQDIAGVEVTQPDAPFALRAIGQYDTGPHVEVEADARRIELRGQRG